MIERLVREVWERKSNCACVLKGRQNFQLPAGAAFAAWKKGTHLEGAWGAYITGVHRAAVQEVHLNNLVGYKRVRSPEVLEVF